MRKLIALGFLTAAIAAIVAVPAAANSRGTNGKIVVNVDNSVTGQEQVYTVDPDGTNMQLLANDTEAGEWSPDGTKIPLASGYLDVDTGAFTDLHLPDGLYPGLFLFCVTWSPDGARLACEGFGEDSSRNGVYTLRSSDGANLQRVTHEPNGDNCPSDYSQNGQRLIVLRAGENTY